MLKDGKLLIGRGDVDASILPAMANRHGLIAGATGTGKTITLKVMAESFSDLGVRYSSPTSRATSAAA